MAGLGDEGLADLAPLLGPHRDVLQVGVVGRQTAGGGRGQGEGGVHAAGTRRDRLDQGVGVGAFQFAELAPVEQHAGQFVALGGQVVEHAGVGRPVALGGLLAAGQAELAEQHVADLLGAAEVERAAHEFLGLGLIVGHAHGELLRQAAQAVRVDADPVAFHLGQHRRQGPLEGLVDAEQAFAHEARAQNVVKAQGDVGVLGRVAGRRVERHVLEALLRLAGPRHGLEGDRRVAEPQLAELVHAVAVQAALQHVGDQHGVVDRRDVDPVAGQDAHVVLGVLRHLEHRGVFQQGLQPRDDLVQRDLLQVLPGFKQEAALPLVLVADGDVAGFAMRHGEGHAAEVGVGRGQGVGLGVEGDQAPRGRLGDEGVQRRQVTDALVGVDVDLVRAGLGPRGLGREGRGHHRGGRGPGR